MEEERKKDTELKESSIEISDWFKLSPILPETSLNTLKEFISSENQTKSVKLNIDHLDKDSRTTLHTFFKPYAHNLETSTEVLGENRMFVVRKRLGRRSQKGLVQFTLRKRNWDTIQAIKRISFALKKKSSDFLYCGTKDKRAETVQKVVAKGMSVGELCALVNRPAWKWDEISISNPKLTNRMVKIGDLLGNRFTIASRFIASPNIQDLEARIDALKKKGFINYFGLQRFGTKKGVF